MSISFTGDTYRTANYLAVKLSPSNLIYKDLFLDPAAGKVRATLFDLCNIKPGT